MTRAPRRQEAALTVATGVSCLLLSGVLMVAWQTVMGLSTLLLAGVGLMASGLWTDWRARHHGEPGRPPQTAWWDWMWASPWYSRWAPAGPWLVIGLLLAAEKT